MEEGLCFQVITFKFVADKPTSMSVKYKVNENFKELNTSKKEHSLMSSLPGKYRAPLKYTMALRISYIPPVCYT
jgi:hypothetical protein